MDHVQYLSIIFRCELQAVEANETNRQLEQGQGPVRCRRCAAEAPARCHQDAQEEGLFHRRVWTVHALGAPVLRVLIYPARMHTCALVIISYLSFQQP